MTNYERIKLLGLPELARIITEAEKLNFDVYCKSDCEGDFESDDPDKMCPHPMECCLKWLKEEAKEK